MTRMTFPQDRTAFVFQGPLQPILTPPRTGIAIYADAAGTMLADLLYLNSSPINDSTVRTGDDGLIPEFLGPNDGSVMLWAKVLGTSALYPIQARTGDLVAALLASYEPTGTSSPALVSGHGNPDSADGTHGSFYVDLDADPQVMWGPKQLDGTWPSEPLQFVPDFPEVPQSVDVAIINPTTEVMINHSLNYPSVVYIDEEGIETGCDVTYPTPNRVVVGFGFPCTGRIHLSP
jgi:hypothetical protein